MILQLCEACFSSSTLVQYKVCPVWPVWFPVMLNNMKANRLELIRMKPEHDQMSILAKVGNKCAQEAMFGSEAFSAQG